MKLLKQLIVSLVFSALLWGLAEQPSSITLNNLEYKPVRSIDLSGLNLINPCQLVADDKYIYIIDDVKNSLSKIDPEGVLLTTIERVKNEQIFPAGLALDYDYLYLADRRGLVRKFSKTLDLQDAYAISLNSQNTVLDPQGLAVDQNHDLYLTDTSFDTFLKFNMQGQVEWQKDIFGQGENGLNNPQAVAVDAHLNIYVLDAGNKRVKVYDQYPELQQIIAQGLLDPRGLCVKNAVPTTLFVADFGRRAVLVYSGSDLIGAIQSFQGKELTPQDVFCQNNILYVLDPVAKQIFLYEIN